MMRTTLPVHTVATTTLRVELPSEAAYALLESNFTLVRYVIPNAFIWKNFDEKYPQLHIALKTQLNRPYITYEHDKLDGKQEMVVYVLYRRKPNDTDFKPTEIDLRPIFNFVHSLLDKREISFRELELHMTLKLLLNDYFHGGWEKAFVGAGKKYIYVSGSNGFHKCLEINLRGHRDNNNQKEAQWFHITGHAQRFRTLLPEESFSETTRMFKPFYIPIVRYGQTTLAQLLPDTVTEKDKVLKPYPDPDHPANIPYHVSRSLDRGRGKLLYDFHQGFILYLSQYGMRAASQTRNFQRYPSKSKNETLPIYEMGTISVLDICIDAERIDEQRTLLWETLGILYPEEQLQSITREQLSELSNETPVLLLQNFSKKDFAEADDDPKQALYREYPHLAKQTLDIRPKPTKGQSLTDAAEQSEERNETEAKSLARRLEVSLKELYLKYILLNNLPVVERLPVYKTRQQNRRDQLEQSPLETYVFLRKKKYDGLTREILLVYENGHFLAHDVGSHPEERNTILQNLGLEWRTIHRELLKQSFKWDEEKQDAKKGKALTRYDLILAPGLAIQIEDIIETVFYNYDSLAKTQQINRQEFPLTRFRLDTAETTFLPKQIEAYNSFLLNEVEENPIAYTRLKKGYKKRIVELLNLRNRYGEAHFQKLTKVYQRMGLLTSGQAVNLVLTSQGIWFDEEGRYVVGDPDSLSGISGKQASAHKVRQLRRIIGDKAVDIPLIMSLIDVRFVRHKRFTVYPYPFKLIDLYAEITHWSL